MLRNVLLVLALASCSLAQAQLPNYAAAPNFSGTTLDGTEVDLYSWLDSNYVVIVDVMAVWCPPCWSYHQTHILRDAYEQYGPNGTNEIRVIMIEADGSTPESQLRGGGRSIGDWTDGTPYPIMNDDSFNANYNIRAFPTFYAIAPNRTVHEIRRYASAEPFVGFARTLAPKSTAAVDAAVLDIVRTTSNCDDGDAVEVVVQNFGAEALTGLTLEVGADGDVETTISNIDLGPYEARGYSADTPEGVLVGGAQNVTAQISGVPSDGDMDNNTRAQKYGSGATALTEVTIEFTTDYNPADALWGVYYNGDPIASKIYNGAPGSANANTTDSRTISLPDPDACYSVFWLDRGGNGANAYVPGVDPVPGMRIIDADGRVILDVSVEDNFDIQYNFGDQREFTFRTSPLASDVKEEVLVGQVQLAPNPARSGSLLQLEVPQELIGEVQVSLVDALGRTTPVAQVDAFQLSTLALPTVAAGQYSLQLRTADKLYVTRLVVR